MVWHYTVITYDCTVIPNMKCGPQFEHSKHASYFATRAVFTNLKKKKKTSDNMSDDFEQIIRHFENDQTICDDFEQIIRHLAQSAAIAMAFSWTLQGGVYGENWVWENALCLFVLDFIPDKLKSLSLSDAIWRRKYESTLVQVMACHLNWCWLVYWTFENKLEWTFYQTKTLLARKMPLKMFSAKWPPFCWGLNV